MRFLKYGLVYILPALFLLGCTLGGLFTFGPVLFAFGFIPLAELFFKPNANNIELAEKELRKEDRKYDVLLYLIVPALYFLVAIYLWHITGADLQTYELTGLTISLGVILGGVGINVAHELGHRTKGFEQTLAKLLLLPNAYMHFFIEHNRGHHKNVSTEEDPASSRYNETVFHFWARSIFYSYVSAWKIENQSLRRAGKRVWSLENEMLRFQIIQFLFYLLIFVTFGGSTTLLFIGASFVGIIMLETVNYIEHYGLQRKKVSEFRYERVQPNHSWNSDHVVGRLMLFELSRHSDHHFQPQKKYQVLEHHDETPQMPTGYPGMMLLSLVPPLWFAIMNPKVDRGFKDAGLKAA